MSSGPEPDRPSRDTPASQAGNEQFEALDLQGIMAARLGRWDEAESLMRRALAIRPEASQTHCNRGNVLRRLGRLDESLLSYERALALKPAHAEAYNNRGNTLRALGRTEEALRSYEAAITLRPHYAEAHHNRGLLLRELWRLPEALSALDRAIELVPVYADAHNERGLALRELDRLEEALASFERALAIDPRHLAALINQGLTLQNLNRPVEAVRSFDAAIAVRPNYATALHNRAYANLLAGNLAAGWHDYEWRWLDEGSPLARLDRNLGPRWTGAEALRGQRILISAEQGLGDTLQFCRYIPLLAERGARVILEAQPPLRRLLSSLKGVETLVDLSTPVPEFDYHCPLLSLPLAFGTDFSNVPADVPYLRAPSERHELWRERLGGSAGLRVGLVWAGGLRPAQPELAAVNRRRNVPLETLARLGHPRIRFFSLQKGQPAESEAAIAARGGWAGFALTDLGPELLDFTDTAAVLETLDLLISVDTAAAHLAGALGRPAWILNRFDTCWRWMLDRSDSPWYPSVRLYRQTAPGHWLPVIERVRADLHALVD
jgi:tetratricopeptide (TPR) repeat protein